MDNTEKLKRITETEQWRMFIELWVDKEIEDVMKRFANATNHEQRHTAQVDYNRLMKIKKLQDVTHGRK